MVDERFHEEDMIDLRELGAALFRRRWVIVAAMVLALLGAYVFTRTQPRIYEATTSVLIKDLSAVGEHMFLDGVPTGAATGRNRVQNGVQLLRSRQVAERAVASLDLDASVDADLTDVEGIHESITIQPVANTETVNITVQQKSPVAAAAIANAVATSFIELSHELNKAEVTAAREFIEEQLVVAEEELLRVEQALRDYRAQAGENASDNELRALTREQTVLEQSFLQLRRRYEDARIAEAMRSSDVAVIDEAIVPERPVSPRPLLNLALGGFLGLFVGLGIALLLEFLDTTFKSAEEVERVMGLPVLGRIPLHEPDQTR